MSTSTNPWIAGASIVSGYLSYKGATSAAEIQAADTAEGRQFQSDEAVRTRDFNSQQSALQLGMNNASNEVQRNDAQASLEYNIQQEQARWDAFEEEFGGMQDNISSYYKNLTEDSVVGKAHHNLEISYAGAMETVRNRLSERGITPKSGFYLASELVLDSDKAAQSAQIVSGAEEAVITAQQQYTDYARATGIETPRPEDMTFKTTNEILESTTPQGIKDDYKSLQEQFIAGTISEDDFKAQMGQSTNGAAYFDEYGIGKTGANLQGSFTDDNYTGSKDLSSIRKARESNLAYTQFQTNKNSFGKNIQGSRIVKDSEGNEQNVGADFNLEDYNRNNKTQLSYTGSLFDTFTNPSNLLNPDNYETVDNPDYDYSGDDLGGDDFGNGYDSSTDEDAGDDGSDGLGA